VEAANAFIREVYPPEHNARFAVEPAGEGSAFKVHVYPRRLPTPSFTDPDASAATTRRERSKMQKTPLKSARRRACGTVDNAAALPTVPQENKTRRSGHMMGYQNRTT
jgi:hypothetical protein